MGLRLNILINKVGGTTKMSAKIAKFAALMVLSIFMLVSVVQAAITIEEVELNDDSLGDGTTVIRDVERGESFDVKVHVMSDADLENVQVEAYVRGYDHNDRVEDITDVFDMKAGVTYVKTLELAFPQRIDQDRYQLRVRVEGRDGETAYNDYDIEVDGVRNDIAIKDVVFSPEGSVQAGRAILASVRVQNYGEVDEDSIKVKVSIPNLGVTASDYIDELDADDSTTSEELYLRIPSCAAAGLYDVDIEVSYDDGDETVRKTTQIRVSADESCPINGAAASAAKPSIIYDASAQDVVAGGAGAVYAITVTNPTSSAKTVAVSVSGVDVFGSAKVSPSNVVVVGASESKTVYVYVNADKDAKAGQYGFTASIAGLSSQSQDIALAAKVVGKSNSGISLVTALEIGLVILIVVLVILGIIYGYKKMNDSDNESEETQTYY